MGFPRRPQVRILPGHPFYQAKRPNSGPLTYPLHMPSLLAGRFFDCWARTAAHIAGSRYNLAGVYTEEVRASTEFEPWHRRRRRFHRAIERILQDGKDSGEFIVLEPYFVREAILGILGRTLTRYSGGQAKFDPSLPDQVAVLVLRSLMIDAARLDAVRTAAHARESSMRLTS